MSHPVSGHASSAVSHENRYVAMRHLMRNALNRHNFSAAAAELLATFSFVFVGVGAVGAMQKINDPAGSNVLIVGLAHGLGIAVGVAAVGRVSGAHMNPAVTIAALITGSIGPLRSVMFVAAQLGGAVLAVFALDTVAYPSGDLGLHALAGDVSVRNGFLIEVILTFILVFVIFATAVDKNGNAMLAPLAIGSTVALGHFVAVPLTGASMNPARSFGPALVHGMWSDHWIYWLSPMAGAIAAGITYVAIFGKVGDMRLSRMISLFKREASRETG